MIETKELQEGDVVLVSLAGADSTEEESECIGDEDVKCKFVNGVFQNIESNHHKGEIYGSSVVSFSHLPTGIQLTGAPEELGKGIYRMLCGKEEEDTVK